jgi:hypothetical protein
MMEDLGGYGQKFVSDAESRTGFPRINLKSESFVLKNVVARGHKIAKRSHVQRAGRSLVGLLAGYYVQRVAFIFVHDLVKTKLND